MKTIKKGEKMKKVFISVFLAVLALGFAQVAQAVPVLQVGAPGGPGEGTYADYTGSLTNPTETDTAVTSGSTLYAAGLYQQNDVVLVGGKYTGTYGEGLNWSDFGFDPVFNSKGAVLMATVPDGTLGTGTLTVGGLSSFYSTSTYEFGFKVPSPPSNHDPVKNQDYMFFDIGNFSKSVLVPNFADETTGDKLGEIKTLSISVSGYQWVHFDVFALVTDTSREKVCPGGATTCPNNQRIWTTLVDSTDDKGNPGSHDVTWKQNGHKVPEPSTLLLLGSGLLGFGIFARRRRK